MRLAALFVGSILIFIGSTATSAADQDRSAPEKCSLRLRLMGHIFKAPLERYAFRSRAWKFSEKQEAAFSQIFNQEDVDDETAFTQLMLALYDAQIKNSKGFAQFFLHGPRRDPYGEKSVYAKTLGRLVAKVVGPHYNPLFNRIASPLSTQKVSKTEKVLLDMMAMHEGAHALDRNLRPVFTGLGALGIIWDFKNTLIKTPLTPAVRYRMETEAVGAQWELAHRIPKEARQRLILRLQEEVKNYPLANLVEIEKKLAELKKEAQKYQIQYIQEARDFWLNSELEDIQFLKGNPHLEAKLSAVFDEFETLSPEQNAPIEAYWIVSALIKPSLSETLSHLHNQITPLHESHQELWQDYLKTVELFKSWSRSTFIKEDTRKTMYNLTLKSLENADLSKQDFIRALLPLHNYDAETMIKEHYRLGFKDFCFLTLGVIVLCINSAAHVQQSAEGLSENYQVVRPAVAFDIRTLQRAQAFLIEPLSSQLAPIVSDDYFLSNWIDAGIDKIQSTQNEP